MNRNDRLNQLLNQLKRVDLLFLFRDGLQNRDVKYEQYSRNDLANVISLELRKAAGNSFANYFRLEHEFPYKRILISVVKRLSPGYKSVLFRHYDNHSEEEIEKEILRLFDLRTTRWLTKLKDSEKQEVTDNIACTINAKLVNRIHRKDFIKHRAIKEVKDSVLTKGLVAGLMAVSAGGALGALGGSKLTSIGWQVMSKTVGRKAGAAVLGGVAGISGITATTLVGATTVGLGVFIPSTIYFYADTNYKKTVPTVIMLLSKVHLNKAFV